MVIGLLVVDFHLEGCTSLKEKRGRMRGLKDRFGKQTNVAVCESGYLDNLKSSQWSFLAAANDKIVVEQTLSQIENYLLTSLDAVITNTAREYL